MTCLTSAPRTSTRTLLALAAASVVGMGSIAIGDTFTWNPAAPGGNDWALVGNWSPAGGPPAAGDIAVFENTVTIGKQPNVYSSIAVEKITLDNSGEDWNLVWNTGSALSLSGSGTGGITVTGPGTSLVGPVTTISNTATFDIGTGATLQFQRNIAGNGHIIKNGAGTVIFNNAASRTSPAPTTINSGTLKITGSGGALGGSSGSQVPLTINNGGTFELGGVGVAGIAISLKDGATLKSTAAGNTIQSSGNLVSLDADAKITIDTGSAGNTLQIFSGAGTINGGSASSLVNVQGGGLLQLSGGNTTYAGGWKLVGGSVKLSNNNGFGNAGSAKVELAGGRVVFDGGSNNQSFTAGVPIKVTADSTVAIDRLSTVDVITSRTIGTVEVGSATMSLDVGAFVSGGGGTGGTATLISGALTLSGDAKFDVPNLPIGGTLTAPVNLVYQPGAITGGANGLEKLGTGHMDIGSASSYSGATKVSGGTLRVTNTGGLGTTSSINVAGGATLTLAAGGTNNWSLQSDLSGSGAVAVTGGSGNTLTLQGSSIAPGSSAGILSITGNTSFIADGSDFPELEIEILGGGEVAGVDYDRLAVSGTVTGLSNLDLVVDFSSFAGGDLTGDVLTILTSSTNFTGQSFKSVSFLGGGSADVNYNPGAITLTNVVPEPATASLLILSGAALLARRHRRS